MRAGGPDNADRLWPVLASGLGDLLQREGAQREALEEHRQRLELLARASRDLARKQQTLLRERIEGVKRREVRPGARRPARPRASPGRNSFGQGFGPRSDCLCQAFLWSMFIGVRSVKGEGICVSE